MKSSMATRKFDRIFTRRGSQSYSQSNSSEQSLSPKPLTKEVRWKVDKSIRKRMDKCAQLLDEQLTRLQSIATAHCRLTLDDETLHEIQAYFLDNVEMCAKQANWREEHDSNLEKYCLPVIDQIDRLRELLSPLDIEPDNDNNTNISSINGIGGDEDCARNDSHKLGQLKTTSPKTISTGSPSLSSTSIRREIEQGWQFWFWRSDQRYSKWEFGLQKLGQPLNNVVQMHKLVHQLIDIHEVAIPSDYSIFRATIKPKWEDIANMDGGSWIIEFERNTTEVSIIRAIWMSLLELLFECNHNDGHEEEHEQIVFENGVVIDVASIRAHIRGLKISMRFKSYQISVWTASFVDLENVFLIGLAIQRTIGYLVEKLPQPLDLFYRAHKVSQQNALIKEQTKFGCDHGFFL